MPPNEESLMYTLLLLLPFSTLTRCGEHCGVDPSDTLRYRGEDWSGALSDNSLLFQASVS